MRNTLAYCRKVKISVKRFVGFVTGMKNKNESVSWPEDILFKHFFSFIFLSELFLGFITILANDIEQTANTYNLSASYGALIKTSKDKLKQ